MLFIANSTAAAVASQANPVSPVYIHMASTSQPTTNSNWQAMTAQPKISNTSLQTCQRSSTLPTHITLTVYSTGGMTLQLFYQHTRSKTVQITKPIARVSYIALSAAYIPLACQGRTRKAHTVVLNSLEGSDQQDLQNI